VTADPTLDPALLAQADAARQLVDAAERVVVLTGAGISTDSGIPDFRGPQGVWTKNPEAEKASNIRYYLADPGVRQARWQQLLTSPYRDREPNAGHLALVHLERRGKLDLLITQNVDGLHHKAGSDPGRIVEIHGNMRQVKCLSCEERAPIERALARVEAGEDDPPCRSCGGILKSATVSFGESLVTEDLERSDLAARSCDLMLTVGTTLAVYPIAHVVPIAKAAGAKVVILNGEATEMDGIADVVVRGGIAAILPRIVGW
jgi:NAD-dependent deacetylase